jgi:hypothetical protein
MKWLLILILIPSVSAWSGATHEQIATNIYYNSDLDLNLSELKRGATDPDRVFHDTRLHHYPKSEVKASEWLEKAKTSLKNNNSNNLSYELGIISHYVSDSFAAPHAVSKEDPKLHSKYENLAKDFFLSTCEVSKGDLKQVLRDHTKEEEWYTWLKTNNQNLIEKHLFNAIKANNLATKNLLNFTCKEPHTQIITEKSNFKELKFFLVLLASFFILKKY